MIKKTLSIILVNFVLIVLILYGFEYLLNPHRSLPLNGYIHGRLYTWGHPVIRNKYGFRERNFETPKPQGTYRVAVFGDSLTYGAGLAPEQRYTAITEQLLNSSFGDKRFEVLNFGISGGPTVRERDLMERNDFISTIGPDLIVIGFCLNDPQPRSQDYSIEKEALKKHYITQFVFSICKTMQNAGLRFLAQTLRDSYFVSAEKIGLIPSWQTALQRTYEPESPEWRQFIQALRDIKNVSDRMGLPGPIFTILNQGTYTDRPTDYRNPDEHLKQFLGWYHQAEKAARDIGFIAYNHETEISRQLNDEPLSVNILDGHPSANLNRIYAEKLHKTISQVIKQRSKLQTSEK